MASTSFDLSIIHQWPTMYGSGTLNVWRDGNNVRVTGTARLYKYAGGTWKFGFYYALEIRWNGQLIDTSGGPDKTWKYIKPDFYLYTGTTMDYNVNYDFTLKNYTSAGEVSLNFVCCGSYGYGYDGGYCTYGCGCSVDSSYNFDYGGVHYTGPFPSIPVLKLPVESAYTASSIWLNPYDYTKIGKVDSSSWAVHYSYNAGSNPSVPISLAIHNYNATSWGVIKEPILDTVSGSSDSKYSYYTLHSSDGFAHGSKYRITLVSNSGEALSPNSWNPQDGLPIYTYQKPTISTVSYTANQNATKGNKFVINGTNNRAWSDYESQFVTQYRIKLGSGSYSGWTSLDNNTTWERSASEMRSLIPKAYDNQTCYIDFKRYSPSSDWWSDSTATATLKVSYRPQTGVASNNTSYRLNNSGGTVITKGQKITADSSLTDIYVSWSYDTDAFAAGLVQGYRVRLYGADGTVAHTYYAGGKSVLIPKADIPKIQNTKIDITPYFKNDSEDPSEFWYFTGTIAKSDFVYLTSIISTPVITYPVNNSNWIHKQFRVCFQMPDDPDKGSEQETYHYENIELKINDSYVIRLADSSGQTSTGTTALAPECFSSLPANLTYQRKIVIYPALSSIFPNDSTYKLSLRVKKKYGDSGTTTWSNWSSEVKITITTPSYNVNEGDKVLATHYNTAKSVADRIRSTYGVNWVVPSDVIAGTTNILVSQYAYSGLYEQLVKTKNQVNNYPDGFDSGRNNLKFDVNNTLETSFNPTSGEYITALASKPANPEGRNYMKIFYNRVEKLI